MKFFVVVALVMAMVTSVIATVATADLAGAQAPSDIDPNGDGVADSEVFEAKPEAPGAGNTPAANGDRVLFFSNGTADDYELPDWSDRPFVDRLTELGYDVSAVPAHVAPGLVASSLLGVDMVVVSPEVISTHLKQWLIDASIPVLILKPSVVQNLGLVRTDFQYTQNVTSLEIEAPRHPIAARLDSALSSVELRYDGEGVTVGTGQSDEPGTDQQVVLRTPNGRPALSAYPIGGLMDDGLIAAGCRVAFPSDKNSGKRMSGQAWTLFDGAVTWLRSAECYPAAEEPGMPANSLAACAVPNAPDGSGATRWVDDIAVTGDTYFIGGGFGVIACQIDTFGFGLQIWSDPFTADGQVHDLEIGGGYLYVGGNAEKVNGVKENIKRFPIADILQGNAAPDPSFDVRFKNGAVRSMALANSASNLYVGGSFGTANQQKANPVSVVTAAHPNGVAVKSLAKFSLNNGGVTLVESFDAQIETRSEGGNRTSIFSTVLDIAVLPGSGALYFGGQFTHVGDQPRSSLARVRADSAVQPFAPDLADVNDGYAQVEEVHFISDRGAARVVACGDWWATEGQGQLEDDGAANRRNQYNVGKFFAWSGNSVKIGGRVWGPNTDGGVMTCSVDEQRGILYLGGHYDFVKDSRDIDYFRPKISAAYVASGQIIERFNTRTDSVRGVDAAIVGVNGTYIAGGAFTTSGTGLDQDDLANTISGIDTRTVVRYDTFGPSSVRDEPAAAAWNDTFEAAFAHPCWETLNCHIDYIDTLTLVQRIDWFVDAISEEHGSSVGFNTSDTENWFGNIESVLDIAGVYGFAEDSAFSLIDSFILVAVQDGLAIYLSGGEKRLDPDYKTGFAAYEWFHFFQTLNDGSPETLINERWGVAEQLATNFGIQATVEKGVSLPNDVENLLLDIGHGYRRAVGVEDERDTIKIAYLELLCGGGGVFAPGCPEPVIAQVDDLFDPRMPGQFPDIADVVLGGIGGGIYAWIVSTFILESASPSWPCDENLTGGSCTPGSVSR